MKFDIRMLSDGSLELSGEICSGPTLDGIMASATGVPIFGPNGAFYPCGLPMKPGDVRSYDLTPEEMGDG